MESLTLLIHPHLGLTFTHHIGYMILDVFEIHNLVTQASEVAQNPVKYHSLKALKAHMGLLALLLSLSLARLPMSHGRLKQPPGRSTMWRYGHDTPVNWNDHVTNCGGFERQWSQNKE